MNFIRVQIHLEGLCREIAFKASVLPFTVLQLKTIINEDSNGYIPVKEMNLYLYPDLLKPEPGLVMLSDDHKFNGKNENFEFVLTLGKMSIWSYYYVLYGERVFKIGSSGFETIAELKSRISVVIKQPVSCIKMKDINKICLDDDSSLYHCGVVNGTILYCVIDVPKYLKK